MFSCCRPILPMKLVYFCVHLSPLKLNENVINYKQSGINNSIAGGLVMLVNTLQTHSKRIYAVFFLSHALSLCIFNMSTCWVSESDEHFSLLICILLSYIFSVLLCCISFKIISRYICCCEMYYDLLFHASIRLQAKHSLECVCFHFNCECVWPFANVCVFCVWIYESCTK
jgi:hypothetical protein